MIKIWINLLKFELFVMFLKEWSILFHIKYWNSIFLLTFFNIFHKNLQKFIKFHKKLNQLCWQNENHVFFTQKLREIQTKAVATEKQNSLNLFYSQKSEFFSLTADNAWCDFVWIQLRGREDNFLFCEKMREFLTIEIKLRDFFILFVGEFVNEMSQIKRKQILDRFKI